MTTAECSAAFPGLTREIDMAVARGPFELKKMPKHATGVVQGRIEDGKVGFFIIFVVFAPLKLWEGGSSELGI